MKPFIALFACLTFSATSFGQAEGKSLPLPPDLAVVPGDSFAVVHVKLSDIWKNDSLKDVRAILEKAGAQTIATFDKRFTPAPSSIERITVYFPIPDFMNGGPPEPVFAIAVGKPYDREAFLKQLENPKKHDGKNGVYYTDAENTVAVRFIDDRHFAMGPPDAIQNMSLTAKRSGPMAAAIELAMGNRPLVIGFNSSAIPQEVPMRIMETLPPRLHPLLAAKTVLLSLDLEGDGHIHAKVAYADLKSAEAAEMAVDAGTEWARQEIGDFRKQLTARALGDGKSAKLEDFPEAAASFPSRPPGRSAPAPRH